MIKKSILILLKKIKSKEIADFNKKYKFFNK